VFFGWHCLGAGLVIVGWQDMIAKVIPVDRRGRFFGITNFGGTATAILGAVTVKWLLETFEFPMGYVLSFTAAGVLILISWFFISQTREPAVPSSKPPVSQWAYLRTLPAVIRGDANFTRYLVAQIVISLSTMGVGFLVIYPSQRWNIPDSEAGGYIIALQTGQALANLAFGALADRRGHKLIVEIGTLASVIAFGLAFIAPSPLVFYPVFFLRGASLAALLMSGISIALEFSSPENRPTYIGLANTIPGIASSAAPLLGGWLASVAGYPPLFALSGAIGVLGLILLRWSVREPRFFEYNSSHD
jgi:MFS family permease